MILTSRNTLFEKAVFMIDITATRVWWRWPGLTLMELPCHPVLYTGHGVCVREQMSRMMLFCLLSHVVSLVIFFKVIFKVCSWTYVKLFFLYYFLWCFLWMFNVQQSEKAQSRLLLHRCEWHHNILYLNNPRWVAIVRHTLLTRSGKGKTKVISYMRVVQLANQSRLGFIGSCSSGQYLGTILEHVKLQC